MAKAEFEKIGQDLATENPDVTISQMFGMPVLKVGKSAFAGLAAEAMTFKLAAGSPEHTAALKLAGSKLFDPMGGRPMKEWVQVGDAESAHWPELARAALAYVESKNR